jgi:uncharacterized protein
MERQWCRSGLESDIPQETLDRIIRDDMVPAFRQGDYAGGLEKGVRRLQEVTSSVGDP